MRNKIIAAVLGISMLMTCSPVFAKDITTVKHVNNINYGDKSSKASFDNFNADVLKGHSKLKNPKVKLNEDSLKNKKEKATSKSNFLLADTQTTTGPAVTINDSPGTAYVIGIDSVCGDTITSEGAERWYAFQNSFIQKLTVIMQAPNSSNIDYNLSLYKYNEETQNLDLVTDSIYYGTAYENLSAIGEKGIYFIRVNSAQGFDDQNQYIFEAISSSQYGKNEPDDNIYQAKPYSSSLSIVDTIDNDFDEDWSSLQLNSDTNGVLSFQNSSTKGTYEVRVYDDSLSLIATLKNTNSLTKKFPKGTYYMRVLSLAGSDSTATYNLNFANKDSVITKATITDISSDADGGYMDYGYGKMWRVHYDMTVKGTAYNQYGNPVANQSITAGAKVVINGKLCTGTGTTDANGNFSIAIHLGPASGNYSYDASRSTHYYDIIPFAMATSNGNISTNVSSLYHFAYSMYHG